MIRQLAGALLMVVAPATAMAANPDYSEALAALQAKDARLQSIGWRLATGNAPYCAGARLALGLLVQDVTTYNEPNEVRRAAGLAGDIAVQAVADGSPAQRAGLRSNEEILAIAGTPVAALPASPHQGRIPAIDRAIAEQLARTGAVTLRLRGAGTPAREVTLSGVNACPGQFEIVTGRTVAQADGERILIGERYGDAARPAESLAGGEYAVIVAHEFAHNLLGHRARLDRIGRGAANVRKIEREADRLSVWLLINAGIAPEVALAATEGWRRRQDSGLLRAPTHAGWRERRATIAEEIDRVHGVLAQHGTADWSRWFQRED